MTYRSFYLVLLLLLAGQFAFAQTNTTYHRVKVRLEGRSLHELTALGLETDHGEYAPHRHYTNDLTEAEVDALAAAGFSYEVLIRDMEDFYSDPARRQAYADNARGGGPSCEETTSSTVTEYPLPSNFRLGDMAGFYRYDDVLSILDSMRLLFPNLISSRQIVSPSIVTHEGRPIYWMRISDNPDTDETVEPEVFYNAIHHAREPNGLTQMVFYMWYLLENYETDPEVRFLVDNTEMYFMPIINPDGYILNETNSPNGGGLWRKNVRANEDGTTGVDLNRNYGYEWGFDDFGSSPNPGSQTYRGPAGFSEPETQAVREFCNAHEFVAALNYHTFGNLLIYPWGYSDSPTPDAPTFGNLAGVMTLQNNYLAGTGSETVGYTVNGGSDDWMYGEEDEKPKMFSMTPEVGEGGADGGFWPVRESIIPNCRASVWMNLMLANFPHVAGVAQPDPAQAEINNDDLYFRYSLRRFGLMDGPLTVSLSSLQDDLIQVIEEPTIFTLGANEMVRDSFALDISGTITPGTELRFLLQVDNGQFVRTDTVSKVYGGYVSTPVLTDNFPDLDGWITENGWGLTDEDFVSGPNSLTDSPYSDYSNNNLAEIVLIDPITVGQAEEYRLTFWSKWDIEAFYDWAQLQISVDGGPWIPVCGRYTVNGSELQDFDQPVWEGRQLEWVEEAIDLTPFLSAGDQLRFRFVLVSDGFVNPDGFYVDDLVFAERNADPVGTTTILDDDAFALKVIPNPNRGRAQLQFRLPKAEAAEGTWRLLQTDGRMVQSGQLALPAGYGEVDLDLQSLPAGVYWLQAEVGTAALPARKIVVLE